MKTLLVSLRTKKLLVAPVAAVLLLSSCNSCGKKTHCDAYSSYKVKNNGEIVKIEKKRSDS